MHSASAKEMRFIKIMQQEAYTAQRSQQHNRGSYPNSPQKQYKKVYSIQVCFVELPPLPNFALCTARNAEGKIT